MAFKGKSGDDALGSREFHVDVHPQGNGFLLTIGHTSIWFDRGAAEEMWILLDEAMAGSDLEWLASEDSN